MLKNYELLYIVHPDLEGSTEKVTEKVTGFINKINGEITNQEDWGKRKLAYPVGKNDFGVYILVNFTAESGLVPQVENNLKLSEEIMRFMAVALPEVITRKPKAKKAKPEVEKEAKVEKPVEKKEETVVEEKVEVVKEEKPKKAAAKKAVKEEDKNPSTNAQDVAEKPKKKAEKPARPAGGEGKAEEAERMKKLDEKLEQILGE